MIYFSYKNPLYFAFSSATATPSFVGRTGDEIGEEVKAVLEAAYRSSGLNLNSLCLLPAKHCWIVFVDLLVRFKVINCHKGAIRVTNEQRERF